MGGAANHYRTGLGIMIVLPNNVLERTARKALVSGRHAGVLPARLVETRRQAVAQHGR